MLKVSISKKISLIEMLISLYHSHANDSNVISFICFIYINLFKIAESAISDDHVYHLDFFLHLDKAKKNECR